MRELGDARAKQVRLLLSSVWACRSAEFFQFDNLLSYSRVGNHRIPLLSRTWFRVERSPISESNDRQSEEDVWIRWILR